MKIGIYKLCMLICLWCFYEAVGMGRKLIYVNTIFRHGSRTPTHFLPHGEWYAWKELGPGQLLPTGMREEENLGQYFRKRYIDTYHFLPGTYDHYVMYVQAAGEDRTLMSAQCFLYGLYPLGSGPHLGPSWSHGAPALKDAMQPIPIYMMPVHFDTLLSAQSVYKKELKALQKKYLTHSRPWIEMEQVLKKHFPLWSQIWGRPIHSLWKAEDFASNMFIRLFNQIQLPPAIHGQKNLFQWLFSWINAQKYQSQSVGLMISKAYLRHLLESFQHLQRAKSRKRFFLYSAHDTNILCLMSALGMPLKVSPPYASYLTFEIYQYDQGPRYRIHIIYNGKPMKLPIAGATTEGCPLNLFIKYLKKLMPLDNV